MRAFLVLVLYGVTAAAQPQAAPKEKADGPAASRADILKLFEIDGTRAGLQERIKLGIEQGQAQVMKSCPQCAPEFGVEWARRMTARYKLEDALEIIVRAYTKYLNNDDLQRMITFVESVKRDPQTAVPPPELKAKLESVLPSMQGEIVGATTQLGAKLGSEIGMEIQKEHPEWVKISPDPAGAKPDKP